MSGKPLSASQIELLRQETLAGRMTPEHFSSLIHKHGTTESVRIAEGESALLTQEEEARKTRLGRAWLEEEGIDTDDLSDAEVRKMFLSEPQPELTVVRSAGSAGWIAEGNPEVEAEINRRRVEELWNAGEEATDG